MPEVRYTVEEVAGVWTVGLNGKSFGPYSTLDAAVVAASNAAHKAEAVGYDAIVEIKGPPDPAPLSEAGRDAA